jgi:hypothetical protein
MSDQDQELEKAVREAVAGVCHYFGEAGSAEHEGWVKHRLGPILRHIEQQSRQMSETTNELDTPFTFDHARCNHMGKAAIDCPHCLRHRIAELEAAFPHCEEHKPDGGARSGCLICSIEKLSFALSQIDYACGEPNEMGVSNYDLSYDAEAVVQRVTRLREFEAKARGCLGEIRDYAEGHHSDQPGHVFLHSLTVDIPSMCDAALSPDAGKSLLEWVKKAMGVLERVKAVFVGSLESPQKFVAEHEAVAEAIDALLSSSPEEGVRR